jgi:hypothetical protein
MDDSSNKLYCIGLIENVSKHFYGCEDFSTMGCKKSTPENMPCHAMPYHAMPCHLIPSPTEKDSIFGAALFSKHSKKQEDILWVTTELINEQ